MVKDLKEGPFLVVKVTDGDTIDLSNGETVRFSGINTPEKGECYYNEAKQALTELVLDKEVFIERDMTNKDKYNRLLRYVYIDDLMANSYLVQNGYAKVYDAFKDTTKFYQDLKKDELTAQQNNLGRWSCDEPESCLYVGSKNSNKYYPQTCKYALRILPENKVCYTSEDQVKNLERTTGCSYN